MAAYGALVSLIHIINNIQNHPRPPISLDKKQVKSLTENITFLQEFLEAYDSHSGNKEMDDLRSRIKDAAYAAEYIIGAHLAHRILAQSTTHYEQDISSVDLYLYQDLQKVIQDMDSMEKEAMEIKVKIEVQEQMHRNSTPVVSSRSPSTGQNLMLGFDDVFKDMMDKLIGHQSDCHIIPIVGMGGIGKTTLARNLYENQSSENHFDVRAWVTVSQEYNMKEILSKVLSQVSRESSSGSSEKELGEKLHKSLFGQRYLVVLDDMWSIKAWEGVKFYLQDNQCRSRIIITTRISDVATNLTGTRGLKMKLLDDERSWELLRTIVFKESNCPLHLKKIGEKIAKNCKGLPLSITVIGGLLAKSNGQLKDWKHIAENLNADASLSDNERCLKILRTSYDLLPAHLKSCFLYMGTFPEDSEIQVSLLMRLWVSQGFLKPDSGKCLEMVAKEYLMELIDRNLVLVRKRGFLTGKIKSCNIHDLLRKICLEEAQRDEFLCIKSLDKFEFPFAVPERMPALQSASLIHSLICDFHKVLQSRDFRWFNVQKEFDGGLYDGEERYNLDTIFQLVNLKQLVIKDWQKQVNIEPFPSSVCLIWNLTMLIVKYPIKKAVGPPEIWNMPQLKHVEFYKLRLPEPPSGDMDKRDDFVLGNLHTLVGIMNFKFGEEVVKRIPNVKKLKVSYEEFEEGFKVSSHYCLKNLGRLHELESLACSFSDGPCRNDLLHNLTFPESLKKLTLCGTELCWEDMSSKLEHGFNIGSLPLLEVLKLKLGSFIGRNWETVQTQFRSLRGLLIDYCVSLRHWTAESTHFPDLECLVLRGLFNLKEIPSGIGETLKSIHLDNCSDSAVISAKQMVDEQEELGNKNFQVTVRLAKQKPHLQILASHNFQVRLFSEN